MFILDETFAVVAVVAGDLGKAIRAAKLVLDKDHGWISNARDITRAQFVLQYAPVDAKSVD